MSRRITAVVFGGAGTAGTQIIKSLISHQIEIVGAVEVAQLSEDVGTHAGLEPQGVVFEADAAAVLERTKPDIAVLAIATGLSATFASAGLALERGVDVVTIAEDAFYPMTDSDRLLASEIDALAKANGATFFATGMQDLFWQNAMTVFSSVVNDISRIHLVTVALQDGLSQAVLDSIYANRTVAEFEASAGGDAHVLFDGVLAAVAADLGLTPAGYRSRIEPITTSVEHRCRASDLTIEAGRILGTRELGLLRTAEGIELVAEFQAKLGEGDEVESSRVTITGSNSVTVHVDGMSGFENTAAIVVNRIPDVLAARPGYLTVGDMPRPSHKAHPAI
ncbi:MAG: hypothetical protein KIT69_00145 [Propionibacteriaceae bacterium]|nr:hypothetical protein [Propionibacteriaceae bacterium]